MKHLRYIFYLLCAVCMAACSEDEVPAFADLCGVITDAQTGTSIPGAEVIVQQNNYSQHTDGSGYYIFRDLEPGTYNITIEASGYKTVKRRVTIYAAVENRCDISLESDGREALNVTPRSLSFTKGVSELTLSVRNNSSTTVSWSITGITVPWLSVSPDQGETRPGSSSVAKVLIDRSILQSALTSTSFVVEGDGFSIPVSVQVNDNAGGNEVALGRIEGRVVDEDNRGISAAEVVAMPGNRVTTTDNYGMFSFTEVPEGTYTLDVTAAGYTSKRTEATVTNGNSTSVTVTMQENITQVTVSPSKADFGKTKNSIVITMTNNSTVEARWELFEDVPLPLWLSVSKRSGTIASYGTDKIELKADRSLLSESKVESFIAFVGNFNNVLLDYSIEKDGGSTPGTDPDPVVPEDYSSATIYSCDSRVEAKIVSCRRTGTNVEFVYTLKNTGLGAVNDWRIYPPKSMSLISGGTRSVIWTDSQSWDYPYMEFNGKSTSGSNIVNTTFPQGPAIRGVIRVSGASVSDKKLNVILGVYAYPNSTYGMASSSVDFYDIPIY